MKHSKLYFNTRMLHEALGLAGDVTVVGFYTTNDPDSLLVLLDSERVGEELPLDVERPPVHLRQVRG